ncbi:Metal ion-binding protein [Hirschfeldia incana]|nr:Metal ion-binding protein [Hirschfeldia incana]
MTSMFSSNRHKTRLTCGFKVNTNSPEWHKSMTKILKKIRGGSFWIDVDEGMAYVTGQGDPNKLLKLMASRKGKDAEMAFVKTGIHHHNHDHSNFGNSYQNSYFSQLTPYWPGHPFLSHGYYYPSGPPAMQPYVQQYPYQGGYGYSYY